MCIGDLDEIPAIELATACRPAPIARTRILQARTAASPATGPAPARSSGPDPSTAAWSRAQQYLDRLFDALDALEEAGGLTRAAEVGGWRASPLAKATRSIEAARDALDDQLRALGIRREA